MKQNKQKNSTKKIKRDYQILIKAENLEKKYRAGDKTLVDILKKVNLAIVKGEIIAIIGPSGCGKSTLLNCLSGIDTVDGGFIYYNGEDISKFGEKEKNRFRGSKMGFIFQSFNLIPVLTAVENVELPALAIGTKPKISREKALELLDELGMGKKANIIVNNLSGGEKQRVAIARSLVNSPEIVWADEPTGNPDTENSNSIMELILRLNESTNTTFVIVTHDPNVALKANKVIRMDSGRILG